MEITKNGILVPSSAMRTAGSSERLSSILKIGSGSKRTSFTSGGVHMGRDPKTLAAVLPYKGSGLDDHLSRAAVDGLFANIGLAPIIHPQLAAVVQKLQSQAAQAEITLLGDELDVQCYAEGISRFNDSPMGFTAAMARFTRQMIMYNRGAPIATIPITRPMDCWEENGLNPVEYPTAAMGKHVERGKYYYMTVDWDKWTDKIPFLPDVFRLEATGDAEWPYWYLADVEKKIWVLLHQDHIIKIVPGIDNPNSLYGTAPVWMYWNILAENIHITDARIERITNQIYDGILGIGGLDLGTDSKAAGESIEMAMEERLAGTSESESNVGSFLFNGNFLLASGKKITFEHFNLRQHHEHADADWEKWKEFQEDVLALCMGVDLTFIVSRGGIGYGANSSAARANTAETGVNIYLHAMQIAMGRFMENITVSITRPNDLALSFDLDKLETFANAMDKLRSNNGDVLTIDEQRAWIRQNLIRIPDMGAGATILSGTPDEEYDSGGEEPDTSRQDVDPEPEDDDGTLEDEELRRSRSGLTTLSELAEEWALSEPVPEGFAVRQDIIRSCFVLGFSTLFNDWDFVRDSNTQFELMEEKIDFHSNDPDETMRAFAIGQLVAAKGRFRSKRFDCSPLCNNPDHIANDGLIVAFESEFPSGIFWQPSPRKNKSCGFCTITAME